MRRATMPDPALLSHAAAKKVDRAMARLEELQCLLRDAASSSTMKKNKKLGSIGFGRIATSPPAMSDGHSTSNPSQERPRRTPLACKTNNTRTQQNIPMDCQSSSKHTTSSSSYQHAQQEQHHHQQQHIQQHQQHDGEDVDDDDHLRQQHTQQRRRHHHENHHHQQHTQQQRHHHHHQQQQEQQHYHHRQQHTQHHRQHDDEEEEEEEEDDHHHHHQQQQQQQRRQQEHTQQRRRHHHDHRHYKQHTQQQHHHHQYTQQLHQRQPRPQGQENQNPGRIDMPRTRRTRLCSQRPATSISTAGSTTLSPKKEQQRPRPRPITTTSRSHPATNSPPSMKAMTTRKMPKKLLHLEACPTNPNRPWHFSLSSQTSTTSRQTTRTTTSTSGQGTTFSGKTSSMSGKTKMVSSRTATMGWKTPTISTKTKRRSMSGPTSTTPGRTGNVSSRQTTDDMSMQTSILSRKQSTTQWLKPEMSEEIAMLSDEAMTMMLSEEESTRMPHKAGGISDRESTMPDDLHIPWRDRLRPRSRWSMRSSLPDPRSSDCSGCIRPLARRLSSITRHSRKAFQDSPEKVSLPSLITRLPTRRGSMSMPWNDDDNDHHPRARENNAGVELTPSPSLSNVLPLPPALRHSCAPDGLGSSTRQRLLPRKASTRASCLVHMGKENRFSGCNPMTLLRRSCSTLRDSGHYILESGEGGAAKGTSSLQAYRVDSPAFQAWKPKPKLYFV